MHLSTGWMLMVFLSPNRNNFFFIRVLLVRRTIEERGCDYPIVSRGLPLSFIQVVVASGQDPGRTETVFAFEINKQTGDLTPCRGRKLEVGCYVIEIDLLEKNKSNFSWLLLLIIPLSLVGFYVTNKIRKKEEKEPVLESNDHIQSGNFRFYPDNNVLKIENNNITLSEKETKALKIFAENINQIVEREKLMKEIWEDKGIVVMSRNVDVLVSKLRRKLSDDNSIKFINVHGRGYKFIIE